MSDLPVPHDVDPADGTLVHNLHDLDGGPDVPADVAAARRAAAATRRLINGLVGTTADAATLDAAAADLERLADVLAPHGVRSRYEATGGLHGGVTADQRVWESHPFIGPGSPLAPPMRITRVGDLALGTVVFTHPYEGPPGAAHGGMVAAMFDLVLGAAASFSPVGGLTGTLSVRYRRPTPLHEPIRYEGWIDRSEERKTFVAGASFAGDTLLAQAEGIFVRVDQRRYDPPAGS